MSIGSEVYFYMLARMFTHRSLTGGFARHRARDVRSGPGSGWSRPPARFAACLCVTRVYFLNSFTGLGLGLVRGSHAVGLVCRRTGTEARYTGASKPLLVAYTRISRSGAVAQRASRSAQGQWEWRVPRPRETSWRSSCVERRGGVGSCHRRGSPGRFAARLPRARSAR